MTNATTQTQTNPRPDAAIAACSLAAASLLAAYSGFQSSNPLLLFGGFLGSAVTAGYWSKRKVSLTDIQAGFGELGRSFEDAVDIVTDRTEKATTATLANLPPEYRPYLDRMLNKAKDTDWIHKFLERSGMVVGASGSGKTVYELFEIHQFLLHNPQGRLLIGDINYGKPTIGKEPNTWFNLPKGRVVRVNPIEVFEAIEETWQELQRRKAEGIRRADEKREIELAGGTYQTPPDFDPWLMLVDEGLATFDALERHPDSTAEKGEKKTLKQTAIEYCSDLLFEGRAYNVRFKIVVQTPLVNETGFGRGKMQQMNFLVLGKSAVDPEVLARIPGIGNRAGEWAEQVAEMRKNDGCKYACLVRMDGADPEVAVHVLPTIDLSQLKVEIPIDILPEHEQWLKETIASVGDEIRSLAAQWIAKEIPSPWETVQNLAGLDKNRSRNPQKFDALKAHWEAVQVEIKGEE